MLTIKKKLPKKCHNGNLRPTDKEKLLSTWRKPLVDQGCDYIKVQFATFCKNSELGTLGQKKYLDGWATKIFDGATM